MLGAPALSALAARPDPATLTQPAANHPSATCGLRLTGSAASGGRGRAGPQVTGPPDRIVNAGVPVAGRPGSGGSGGHDIRTADRRGRLCGPAQSAPPYCRRPAAAASARRNHQERWRQSRQAAAWAMHLQRDSSSCRRPVRRWHSADRANRPSWRAGRVVTPRCHWPVRGRGFAGRRGSGGSWQGAVGARGGAAATAEGFL